MTARGSGPTGFALVELLVALAVLALMAGATVPALGVWLDREPTAAEEVAALLRSARAEALETGAPVTVTVQTATGEWLSEREGRLPLEGKITFRGAEIVSERPRAVIRFGATGGADGGVVVVRQNGRSVVVRADRWTGEVHAGA